MDPVTMTDEDCLRTWECYGFSFAKSDNVCVRDCMVRDRCIRYMGAVRLPSLLKSMVEQAGRTITPDELANACDTDLDSLRLVQTVAQNKAKIEKLLPPQAQPPTETDITEEEEDRLLDQVQEPYPETPPSPAPPPVAPAPEPAPAPAEAGQSEQAMKAERKVQKVVAKKVAKKVPVQIEAPKKAEPKKVQKALPKKVQKVAPKKALPKKVAKKATVQKGPHKMLTAEERAAQGSSRAAFDRERARSPWVGGLGDGALLTRQFRGRELEVKVDARKGVYLLDGQEWPTLYSLVMNLTGPSVTPDGRKTSKWSVKRFFARQD